MIERTGKSRVILVRLSNHRGAKSLVFGSHSLINRIRRTLWVQQQLEEACGEGYLDIDIEACYEFVTLLNMRDHGELNGQPVTEQIYVHSKLMIVDDRWVLVGSANINDRSLLGDGDSELAVTIADMDYSVNDLDGSGTPEPCRTFARDLRQKAWRKWMGSAAVECEEALDKPALKASWEKIQALALNNSIAYDVVFNFIPRNSFEPESSNEINYTGKQDSENEDNIPASIWPILAVNRTDVPHNKINMPFSEVFWRKYHGKKFNNKYRLHDIKGYFTSLAPEWTSGEDNLIPYNMRLIAEYNMQKDDNKKLAIVKIDSSDMETL